MSCDLQDVVAEHRAADSAELQSEHAPKVPTHRDQAPLTFDVLEPSQEKLAKSHRRLDAAEHRLGRLLAQRVKLPACRGLEPMRHPLHGRSRSGRRLGSGRKALPPALVMTLALEGDQRLDARRGATLHI